MFVVDGVTVKRVDLVSDVLYAKAVARLTLH